MNTIYTSKQFTLAHFDAGIALFARASILPQFARRSGKKLIASDARHALRMCGFCESEMLQAGDSCSCEPAS